jgi:hypothetical protein
MILFAECGLQKAGSKSRFRSCVPNGGKYERIEGKNEVKHS